MRLEVAGIGLATRGMPQWSQARAVLRGEQPYVDADLAEDKPLRLPSNERRRATPITRLAFQAAEQAVADCTLPLEDLALVFGSSAGDMHILDRICRTLSTPERAVSPTQFHNSVHNAVAGYWSIATRARGPSTCLSAYDETAGAALVEAATMVCEEHWSVLCICCDQRPVQPLLDKVPTLAPFAAALVLRPHVETATAARIATLELTTTDVTETDMPERALEALRLGNPAARILPLLRSLASGEAGTVVLPAPGCNLAVRVTPAAV